MLNWSNSLQPYGLQPTRLLCAWILQARILEWVAMPSSKGSSQPRDWTSVFYLLHWQVGSLPLVTPGKPVDSTDMCFSGDPYSYTSLVTYFHCLPPVTIPILLSGCSSCCLTSLPDCVFFQSLLYQVPYQYFWMHECFSLTNHYGSMRRSAQLLSRPEWISVLKFFWTLVSSSEKWAHYPNLEELLWGSISFYYFTLDPVLLLSICLPRVCIFFLNLPSWVINSFSQHLHYLKKNPRSYLIKTNISPVLLRHCQCTSGCFFFFLIHHHWGKSSYHIVNLAYPIYPQLK